MKRKITFTEAINEALNIAMLKDKKVICYGLGIDDPKRIFGTTKKLKEKFGQNRVFDTPTSENAMTGVAIGLGLNGYKTVMVHQRLDFFLLAMDQLVNSAAKWHYMFGGKKNVPITIRLIVGRGWGQGPTHSQSLHSWFAHIPGLKVVMPTSPSDAKGLLLSSIFDKNPVIFIEHRWLHNLEGYVEKKDYRIDIGKPKTVCNGKDITIVSMSYMTIEALRAIKVLKEFGIECSLIDLRTISPLDYSPIYRSLKKTGRLMVLDIGNSNVSISSEIVSKISIKFHNKLKAPPIVLGLPNAPVPTSFGLTKDFYPDAKKITKEVLSLFKIKKNLKNYFPTQKFHDIPGEWFKGPF